MDGRSAGMMSSGGEEVGRDFAATLEELKHCGCSLLITGAVDSHSRAQQTRRLFGDPTIDRERVLVLTDTDRSQYIETLPIGLSPDHPSVHLLDYRMMFQSAISGDDPPDEEALDDSLSSPHAPEPTVNGLTDLREAITDMIADIHSRATVLPAGVLRLYLTDLCILLDVYGREAIKPFVKAISAEIQAVRGMGIWSLPVPSDDPVVRSLLPLFDIHIELRKAPATPVCHRWHLCAYGLSSEWLPL